MENVMDVKLNLNYEYYFIYIVNLRNFDVWWTFSAKPNKKILIGV